MTNEEKATQITGNNFVRYYEQDMARRIYIKKYDDEVTNGLNHINQLIDLHFPEEQCKHDWYLISIQRKKLKEAVKEASLDYVFRCIAEYTHNNSNEHKEPIQLSLF